jgi:hypothetical protein
VSNEEDRELERLPQLCDLLKNILLDNHIQSRSGFIHDEKTQAHCGLKSINWILSWARPPYLKLVSGGD